MKKPTLPVLLQPDEISWGIRYLLFSLVFLGSFLSLTVSLLFPGVQNIHIILTYYAVNFLAVLWIFRRFLFQSLQYTFVHPCKLLIGSLIGLAAYFTLTQLVTAGFLMIVPEFSNVNDARILEDIRRYPLLTTLGTVLLVPLAEETLHRGLIFGYIHRKNRGLAYILSTIAFCSIHVTGYIGSYPPRILLLCWL